MAKHCETFEHTADIGLTACADTPGELFEALAEGLAELICPRGQVRPAQTRRVSLQAEDLEALAVDFLTEVMVTMEARRFLVSAVSVTRISDTAVVAELAGEEFDPARHEFGEEVKAVTYHLLRVAKDGERWTGRVILDL